MFAEQEVARRVVEVRAARSLLAWAEVTREGVMAVLVEEKPVGAERAAVVEDRWKTTARSPSKRNPSVA